MSRASRRFGGLFWILAASVVTAGTAAQTAPAPLPLAKPPPAGKPAPESASPSGEAVRRGKALPKPLAKPRGDASAVTEAPPGSQTGAVTGLPVPRFVSLAADKVNARVGPGTNYPITWVYTRRNLPVEVVAEYELFRKIRDHDGSESWVHKNLLSGRRYVLIIGGTRMLRERPEESSAVTLMAEGGVQGRLLKCRGEWCQVEIQGNKGYAPRSILWGVYVDETVD